MMPYALGIDTSNYATSLAVVNAAKEVVSAKKKMLPVAPGQLGLRQSDAVFHHTVALPVLLNELRQEGALEKVGIVGVSSKPRPQESSYMPCFLAGVSAATAFAAALGVAPLQTTHQQGHIAAALHGAGIEKPEKQEALVFHVSGGTTELLHCNGYSVLETVGSSLDLYAGQAVDRLGVRFGFDFPAGAQLSELAAQCNESIRPKTSVRGNCCHLSGLENQCSQLLSQGKTEAYVAKYCLLCIAATLTEMVEAARCQYATLPVVFAGGVVSSAVVREYVHQNLENIYFASPAYSSDNAIGVALIAAASLPSL